MPNQYTVKAKGAKSKSTGKSITAQGRNTAKGKTAAAPKAKAKAAAGGRSR